MKGVTIMATVTNFTLTSDNEEIIGRIMKEYKFECAHCEGLIDANSILFSVKYGIPHDEILMLSKKYKNVTLKVHYSSPIELHSTEYVIDYKNGHYEVVDMTPNYLTPSQMRDGGIKEKLLNKAIQVFRFIDLKKYDKDGKLYIDWYNEEVPIVVYEGNHRMVIKKRFNVAMSPAIYRTEAKSLRSDTLWVNIRETPWEEWSEGRKRHALRIIEKREKEVAHIEMSQYPTEKPAGDWCGEWFKTTHICPKCQKRMWHTDWCDDEGYIITKYICGDCHYSEVRE